MKKTLVALCFLTTTLLAAGCGLCPIPGANGISSYQTSLFKLERALLGGSWTHVGDYVLRQDVTYPPGYVFLELGYAEASPKRKKGELCVQINHRSGSNSSMVWRAEQCQVIKKMKPAYFHFEYPDGYDLEANDLLEMWLYSKKRLAPGTALHATFGYSSHESF